MVNSKYQIVIGYTQKLFADGLESMIDGSEDFAIQGIVSLENLTEYLKTKNSVKIFIIELNYPNGKDLEFLIQLRKKLPLVHILLISQLAGLKISSNLIDSGIDAYILKTCSKSDLVAALSKIVDGNNFFCSLIVKSMLSSSGNGKNAHEISLTQREIEILTLLVNGKTNLKMAKELNLSENTVKTHRRNILSKFGVNNLIGMIRYACRSRLLDYGPDGFCIGCPHYN